MPLPVAIVLIPRSSFFGCFFFSVSKLNISFNPSAKRLLNHISASFGSKLSLIERLDDVVRCSCRSIACECIQYGERGRELHALCRALPWEDSLICAF